MTTPHEFSWMRLDNAAKLFPSTSSERDTRVFRFACELKEEVMPDFLQKALEETLDCFPLYRTVMKKGLFWYYLEGKTLPVQAEEEHRPPCAALFDRNRETHLFSVSWYRCRINLEVFHALSDGAGAMEFLKALVCRYLLYAHEGQWAGKPPALPVSPVPSLQTADGFRRYYDRKAKKVKFPSPRAYQLRGEKPRPRRLKIVQGVVSAKAVLEQAHRCGATLTVYLTALLLKAVYLQMDTPSPHPVVLMVPVNLRPYFPTASARNFFSTISVGYSFAEGKEDLGEVAASVADTFRQELTKERLSARMNSYASLEHNALLRAAPLPLKTLCLNIANLMSERKDTAVISNLGRVTVPEAFRPYIRLVDTFVSTPKLELCVCTFEDALSLTFTSHFERSDVEREFFRLLAQNGAEVEIRANLLPGQEEREEHPDDEM